MEKVNTFKRMSALALAVCLIAVITTTFVSASDTGDKPDKTAQNQEMRGPRMGFTKLPLDTEFQDRFAEVMNSGDYDAWIALMKEKTTGFPCAENCAREKSPNITEIITKDKFAKFAEAWKLKEEARALMEQAKTKMEEARTIEESLGLTRPEGGHPGNRGLGMGFGLKKQFKNNQNSEQDTQE